MGRLIYADNAATTKLDIPVFESMVHGFLNNMEMHLNPIHLHESQRGRLQRRELLLQSASVLSQRRYISPLEVPKVITGLSKVLLFQTRVNEQ